MTFKEIVDSIISATWDNIGIIVLIAVLVFIAVNKPIKAWLKKRKENKQEEELHIEHQPAPFFSPESSVFTEFHQKSVSASFEDQKAKLIKEIDQIKEEGKNLVKEEGRFLQECKEQQVKFEQEKRNQYMKYTMSINQLKMVEDMIVNQKKIEASEQRLRKK